MSENNEICCQSKSEGAESSALRVRPGVTYKPGYQSHYSDNAWEVTVNLPGVVKEHLEVSVENEILEIKATRFLEVPEGWRPLGNYPAEKNYRLRLDVGPEVDPSGITAGLEDGVLKLALPLREEVKPRTIEVK